MVGDGGYLMMPTELVVAVQERVKVVVVIVQNHGFHSIGSLSEALGSQRFGTSYRFRGNDGRLDGGTCPSTSRPTRAAWAPTSSRCTTGPASKSAIAAAKAAPRDGGPDVIHVETDPRVHSPSSDSWWDVPVAQVSALDSTQSAAAAYTEAKKHQRGYLAPTEPGASTGRRRHCASVSSGWASWAATTPSGSHAERVGCCSPG